MDYDWKKRDSITAQALADYLGVEVAGFKPARSPAEIQIDQFIVLPTLETAIRHRNVAVIELMILAALIRGTVEQRSRILSSVNSEDFAPKLLEQYLFNVIKKKINETGRISIQELQESIPAFTLEVYSVPPTKRVELGHYYTWAQILNFDPTWELLWNAIELLTTLRRSR